MDQSIAVAGVIGLAMTLSVTIYMFGRLRIEQERSFQKLIDRGLSGEELLRSAGIADRARRDLRRGILLIAVGIAYSGFTFNIGGDGWTLGIIPITFGIALILFSILDGRFR
ncbi:MAG TPA: DUF6249 domain-containing protein [Vicinamibacterales bacterium]|nr:DUF6249 domain-containing protein [Vicinamibacterales bacterium]